MNAMQVIWLATIDEFFFEIMYNKGNEKRVVDTLSGRVRVNHMLVVSSYETDLQVWILYTGKHDEK